MDAQRAEALLVMRAPGFNFAGLTLAANLVRDGARFRTANPDANHPDGRISSRALRVNVTTWQRNNRVEI